MDETIAHSRPQDWQRAYEMEVEMINMIGKEEFEHVIVDPIPCLQNLGRQILERDIRTVIDLTGWLSPALRELLPDAAIVDDFSLSRVRVVSSPTLDTTGYCVSLRRDEILSRRAELDLSSTLIVDDTSFTGGTSQKAMDLWQLKPEDVTHGFLIANTGNLGPIPGAVHLLESQGSTVISGFEIQTPRDDGWHLKDLHQHPNIEQAFAFSMLFQESVHRDGPGNEFVKKLLTHTTLINSLFPGRMTTDDIKKLGEEERFIFRNGNIHPNEIHANNPFLWASQYFQQHIDIEAVFSNQHQLLPMLSELQDITTHPDGRRQASIEMQHEMHRLKTTVGLEGITRRRERL